MNKLTSCFLALLSVTIFVVIGCNGGNSPPTQVSTATPLFLSPPTPLPPFFHYSTNSKSDIYIEFDYPSSWGMGDDMRDSSLNITLYDPRNFTLPTPLPEDNHPIPNDFGFINIWIRPIQSDESFQQLVDEFANSGASFVINLRNYHYQIAGQDSLVYEYLITEYNPGMYTSQMFGKDIFFEVNHYIYNIKFIIAEKDRGNEFEQGYEYFINSLKVTP